MPPIVVLGILIVVFAGAAYLWEQYWNRREAQPGTERPASAPTPLAAPTERPWTGTFTKARSRELLIARFGTRCWACGVDGEALEVDHIRARKWKRGLAGNDELYNLALLCGPCNRRKSNRLTLEELRKVNLEKGKLCVRMVELTDLFEAQAWAVHTLLGTPRKR